MDEKKKLEREAREKDMEIRKARIVSCVNEVLRTDPGKELFRFLHNHCAFSESLLVVNPITKQVDKETSLYNIALRDVYLVLRGLADRRLIAEVEFGDVIHEVKEKKEENKNG